MEDWTEREYGGDFWDAFVVVARNNAALSLYKTLYKKYYYINIYIYNLLFTLKYSAVQLKQIMNNLFSKNKEILFLIFW